MPAPIVRKLKIDINQIRKDILFPGLNPIRTVNIADDTSGNSPHVSVNSNGIPTANFNNNFPFPNKLKNIFDRNLGTSFRSKAPSGTNSNSDPLTSYLVIDLRRPRKINKISITTNHSTIVNCKARLVEDINGSTPDQCNGQSSVVGMVFSSNLNVFNVPSDFNTNHEVIENSANTVITVDASLNRTNRKQIENKEDVFGFNDKQFLILEFLESAYNFTFDIADISVFEELDTRDFDVDFDDALLDQAGWKNPRWEGSKLTGKKINQYTGPTKGTNEGDPDHYGGDISYGKNPVIENKTTALYIGDTCIGAEDEDKQFTFLEGHSYVGIKQILVINTDSDEVQLIDRDSEDFIPFNKFITSDFPVGSSAKIRVVDEAIQSKLKRSYFVKFNKGHLLKTFEYDGHQFPKHGIHPDGETVGQLTQTAGENIIIDPNPFSLFEGIQSRITNLNADGNASQPTYYNADGPTITPDFLSASFNTDPFYSGLTSASKTLFTYDRDPLTKTLPSPEPGVSSKYFDNANPILPNIRSGQLKFTFGNALSMPLMLADNTKLIKNKFSRQFVNAKNDGTNDPTTLTLESFAKIKKDVIKNQNNPKAPFISGQNAGTISLVNIDPLHERFEHRLLNGLSGFGAAFSGGPLGKQPNITASAFIKGCVNFAETNDELTELHLTLHRGTKDYSFDGIKSKNDALSISTFEIDANTVPLGAAIQTRNAKFAADPIFDKNGNPVTLPVNPNGNDVGSVSLGGPRALDLFLKNSPIVRPAFFQLIEEDKSPSHTTNVYKQLIEFVQNVGGEPGSNSVFQGQFSSSIDENGNLQKGIFTANGTFIPTGNWGLESYHIVERTKLFEQGPGSVAKSLIRNLSGSTPQGSPGAEDRGIQNTDNYSGSNQNSYHIQLSFLDKTNTLILDIDKNAELFDGIGTKGVVLIPELTEQKVKDNIDYYLRKGGIISRKTIKSPRRPEKGS